MQKSVAVVLALAAGLSWYSSAQAKVSAEEAARLGKDLTCTGAEKAGNADGSIPPFTGKNLGVVPGWTHTPYSGGHPVDPWPNEKPLLVITASNAKQHAERLSTGQLAMFEKYPATYRMAIYPTHRDFRYPDYVCERARENALNAELVDNGLGVNAIGQVPFPIPKTALELMWNSQLPARAWTEEMQRDNGAVTPSGDVAWGRSFSKTLANANNPKETPYSSTGVQSLGMYTTVLPQRDNGIITVAQTPYNFSSDSLKAWTYNPGTRRVRLNPAFGFDSPMIGTNGVMTIDDDRIFNGSPERYDWKIEGKREMYVPINSYKVNSAEVKYKDLLTPNHPNPDVMRYELRRVWVLVATLKEGSRHLYGKRVMFIDEDTWHSLMADNYDTRGNIYKYAQVTYYYHPDMSAWEAGAAFFHDLTTGQYVGYSLSNEARKGPILNKGNYTADMFTPDTARAAGR
ncbi:DUF1329 domain-containing protein [Pseudomonas sp. R5(2019)]|uniref:DUF1329 domain-containing protein n=1 Tax=Pseudomonas sp. R5(2019) TaxID=2697566 RepID=UPI001412EE00|nr:DUF1329 domain-containing protein [Pseudomonas sp. R5(2019)]NBA98295.1 DUF1329 domain-containing protein [Pseudomonas sp. R5(2019)]